MKRSELVAALERLPDLECVVVEAPPNILPALPAVMWRDPTGLVTTSPGYADPGTPLPPDPDRFRTVRELEAAGWRRVIVVGAQWSAEAYG